MDEKEKLTSKIDPRQNENHFCDIYIPEIDNKYYIKLKKYENTNLSPEEVVQLKKENEELKSENNEFCFYNKKIREENLKLKAELEKQLADKKETATYKNNFCINCCKDKSGEQIICLKCHEEVCNAFKKQLAEKDRLLENTVIPKFKIGDEVWIIKRIKQEVANGKVIKKYLYFNGGTPENLRNVNRWRIRLRNNSEVTKKEYELFYTRKEAEEALKKLEEK